MDIEKSDNHFVLSMKQLSVTEPQAAITKCQEYINSKDITGDKEAVIYLLAEIYVNQKKLKELQNFLYFLSDFYFNSISKARSAKIVRTLIDTINTLSEIDISIEFALEAVEWCKNSAEQRTFLRQRIELKLTYLLIKRGDYILASKIISTLIKEIKKLDDKLFLLEVYLCESFLHLSLKDIPKSKAALTAARACATAVYCPPDLQVQLDSHSGIICCEENDFRTAYSYFFEAYEGSMNLSKFDKAVVMLKYMILCKIMSNEITDVQNIAVSKAGLRHAGSDLDAMIAIASAHKNRSLEEFNNALSKYKQELLLDPIISTHLDLLHSYLVERTLLRIIEPFSRVQITHVAKLINLPLQEVQAKLAEMILDKKLNGILDQGSGDLIVYEQTVSDDSYNTSLEVLKSLGVVVDKLYSTINTSQK